MNRQSKYTEWSEVCPSNFDTPCIPLVHIYKMSRVECARLRENVPYVKVHRYNPKHLYPKLNGYGDNGERSLKSLTAVTHLLITKFILKLAGICDFCNVNTCT